MLDPPTAVVGVRIAHDAAAALPPPHTAHTVAVAVAAAVDVGAVGVADAAAVAADVARAVGQAELKVK